MGWSPRLGSCGLLRWWINLFISALDVARGRDMSGGYIYVMYIPNLGLVIAVFVQEREQWGSMGDPRGSKGENAGGSRY